MQGLKVSLKEGIEQVRSLVERECQGDPRLEWFWKNHILVVTRLARELAISQGADVDIVVLGAYLHDISRIRRVNNGGTVDDGDNHDVEGAAIAEGMMMGLGFDKEIIRQVRGLILSHRCQGLRPQTLEEKVLATTDAASHFTGRFYLSLFWLHEPKQTPEELAAFCLRKLERDFHGKIFFADVRNELEPAYEALKLLLSSFTAEE